MVGGVVILELFIYWYVVVFVINVSVFKIFVSLEIFMV